MAFSLALLACLVYASAELSWNISLGATPSEAEYSSERSKFSGVAAVKHVSSSVGVHTRALEKTAQPRRLV